MGRRKANSAPAQSPVRCVLCFLSSVHLKVSRMNNYSFCIFVKWQDDEKHIWILSLTG